MTMRKTTYAIYLRAEPRVKFEVVTHTSNERLTEKVLFSGMCAHVRETYVKFLADQRASRKMATRLQKSVLGSPVCKDRICYYCAKSVPVDTSVDMRTLIIRAAGA
ncbi:hypothetical protein TNCV_4113501 [Trichonephila clavipes]|nr:hypothetical protein TNCV_4113501 [Trichonephila clavipes]